MGAQSKLKKQEDSNESRGFEKKKTDTGNINPKYVDVLDEDKQIAGQKFVCISFISPEKIVKQKEFLNFVSYKYKLSFDEISKDFKEFLSEEQELMCKGNMEDDYKTFMDQNEEELENAFNLKYNFQTSTRGIKIRGVYPTMEEAELRCKMLREIDENHDVFVGPVGLWMPWDPEAYKTGRVEYMEDELNQLMHEKNKNESFAKSAFDQRVKETKKKAIEENIKNAEKTGATLTQNIDADGNLIGVGNMNTQEKTMKDQESISAADIRAELFEGENIIIGKTDNGQSELLSGPFSIKAKEE
jgi:hypothetical protein